MKVWIEEVVAQISPGLAKDLELFAGEIDIHLGRDR